MGKTEKLHNCDGGYEIDQGLNDSNVQKLWPICQKAQYGNEQQCFCTENIYCQNTVINRGAEYRPHDGEQHRNK